MVDFKKKIVHGNKVKITNPVELYKTLDRKSIAGPLRPVQEYTLTEWYDNRKDEKDLIVKLHTGEGKTLIGLLMLQSALNQENGPCLYVCPNIYLFEQVCIEAEKFGIPICTINHNNEIPNEFLAGEKILITHAHKVFNGKSIFGVGNRYIKAGTIILDDSHACIDVLRDAFTLSINRDENESLYQKILNLFSEDLMEQGEGSYLDIKSENSETFMHVPYWAWIDKREATLSLLSKESNSDILKFSWPLIKDRIIEYSCFVSGSKVEIAPYNISAELFGTFSKANKRILMSATTQEDIFFIKGLDFSKNAVNNPIIYPVLRWSGEKMIIIPSLINDECDRNLVATTFAKISNEKLNYGIVSIVSNTKRANYYKELGAEQPRSNNELLETINNLKKRIFKKTVVINNRYDGIDLPDESCRILIIDSMPYLNNYLDKYEEKCCPNSEIINKKLAQKIEQGIGRSVRGEKDYCAIIITGSDIVKFMRGVLTKKYFSNQTRKQIDIGIEVAKMAKEEIVDNTSAMKPIYSLINQMIKRDEGWKEYYSNEMNSIIAEEKENVMYEKYISESKIEKLFSIQEYEKAVDETQKFIDKFITDELERGWYLERMARYAYLLSKNKSMTLQKQAFIKNSQLLKPKNGILYSKISFLNENRLKRIKNYIKKYRNFDELNLHVNTILDNFTFGVPSDKFESSLKEIGEMLGYKSQRPDLEIRKGPDNLWCGLNNNYIIFECKNEVDENRAEIYKTEVGQFNNHCGWFKKEYGEDVNVLRIMIIPIKKIAYQANFNEKVFAMRKNRHSILKANIRRFIQEIKNYELDSLSDEKIQSYLNLYKLNMEDFEKEYVEEFYYKKK